MPDSVLFIGSKHFGLECLKGVCRSVPDAQVHVATLPGGFDDRDIPEDFEAFCKAQDIPVTMLPKGEGLHELVEKLRPDLCVVVGWYRIIPDATLAIPGKGFVGVHASLLPKYRGGAPLVWAIINGETTAGTTLFRFDPGMDSGDIVGQAEFDIAPDDTIAEVVTKAETASVRLLETHTAALLDGTAILTPQNHDEATTVPQRKPADGRIDWSQDARRVHDFIRAQTRPYPGAFYVDDAGREVRIWRASVYPATCEGKPGEVSIVDDDTIVCCGDGALAIHEVQQAGADTAPAKGILKQGDRLS